MKRVRFAESYHRSASHCLRPRLMRTRAGDRGGGGTMTIPASAAVLANRIERVISSARVTSRLLMLIQKQVEAPRGQEECVIESLFRCLISADIQNTFHIPNAEIPLVINSSHRRPRRACLKPNLHAHRRLEDDTFSSFARRYGVDFYEDIRGRKPALRRADLFVAAQDGPLSIEFKYLRPQKMLNDKMCIQQMRFYTHHAASVLVVYAAREQHNRLSESIERIRKELKKLNKKARLVKAEGPAVMIT